MQPMPVGKAGTVVLQLPEEPRTLDRCFSPFIKELSEVRDWGSPYLFHAYC